jgi:hypothetical protein
MSLKLSKGVKSVYDCMGKDNVFSLVHYDTTIFTYNETTKKAWTLQNCSMTSNKQIKRAVEWFKPLEIERINNPIKWGFSN